MNSHYNASPLPSGGQNLPPDINFSAYSLQEGTPNLTKVQQMLPPPVFTARTSTPTVCQSSNPYKYENILLPWAPTLSTDYPSTDSWFI
jgi:hypothetical protein